MRLLLDNKCVHTEMKTRFCAHRHVRIVYRRLLMVGTKSRGYSNSGRLSEGEYSVPFFCTRPSPTSYDTCIGETQGH